MEMVKVTSVALSKNKVEVSEKVKITVFASSITKEPANKRLAFILGRKRPKT